MYINGLGFVNENAYTDFLLTPAKKVTNTSSATAVNSPGKAIFDNILATETAKLKKNDEKNSYRLDDIFREAAEKYNVSYDLLKAIGYHESRFKTDATSRVGAMGIMQLMPQTAKALGVTDGYDPYQNIMGAAKLLGKLSDMYDGDQTLMLAAYSAGTGNVAKYGGVPPFEETQNFISDMSKLLNQTIDVSGITVTANPVNNMPSYYTETSSAPVINTKEASENSEAPGSSRLLFDGLFSYDQYKLLMYYFENMLDIISGI